MDDKNGIHLCDFGMAKFLDDSKTEICRIAGTTEYCAPEQIQFDPLSPASDMWSVGCCAFVLLSKISPFKREKLHETQNAVIDGDFDFDGQIWNTRSNEAKNFISKLLQNSPKVILPFKNKPTYITSFFLFLVKIDFLHGNQKFNLIFYLKASKVEFLLFFFFNFGRANLRKRRLSLVVF